MIQPTFPCCWSRLNEGYDLVSGWRKHRQDNRITRLLPSMVANWLIGTMTGVKPPRLRLLPQGLPQPRC